MFSLHIKAKREHAIVIGGGIAGLLATRILADHFAQVTLIERDRYPRDPAFRPGVPQGRQVHTLLLRGQRELEGLFPGLGQRLLLSGGSGERGSKAWVTYPGDRDSHPNGWVIPGDLAEAHVSARKRISPREGLTWY